MCCPRRKTHEKKIAAFFFLFPKVGLHRLLSLPGSPRHSLHPNPKYSQSSQNPPTLRISCQLRPTSRTNQTVETAKFPATLFHRVSGALVITRLLLSSSKPSPQVHVPFTYDGVLISAFGTCAEVSMKSGVISEGVSSESKGDAFTASANFNPNSTALLPATCSVSFFFLAAETGGSLLRTSRLAFFFVLKLERSRAFLSLTISPKSPPSSSRPSVEVTSLSETAFLESVVEVDVDNGVENDGGSDNLMPIPGGGISPPATGSGAPNQATVGLMFFSRLRSRTCRKAMYQKQHRGKQSTDGCITRQVKIERWSNKFRRFHVLVVAHYSLPFRRSFTTAN